MRVHRVGRAQSAVPKAIVAPRTSSIRQPRAKRPPASAIPIRFAADGGLQPLLWIESLFVTGDFSNHMLIRRLSDVMPATPGPPDTQGRLTQRQQDTQKTREIQQHKNGGLLFEFSDIGANPVVLPRIWRRCIRPTLPPLPAQFGLVYGLTVGGGMAGP